METNLQLTFAVLYIVFYITKTKLCGIKYEKTYKFLMSDIVVIRMYLLFILILNVCYIKFTKLNL